jgi:hypothetical protein
MKATKLTLAAILLAGTCGFAMAQGGGPKGSDANPPAAVKTQPGESNSAPAQGAGAPAPKMQTAPTGMTEPNNSTGNMNTKGAGPGTTGTGGKGGSGNQ